MKKSTFDTIIAANDGKHLQIKLRDVHPQPIGPGIVTEIDGTEGAYRIVTEAQLQNAKTGQLTPVLLPVVFDVDDVLWVSEAPVINGEASAIIMPGNSAPRGGLHIPGGD